MDTPKQDAEQLLTALVLTKMSRFVFDVVSQGRWPHEDMSGHAGNVRKLFSLLKSREYHSYVIDLDALDGEPEDIAQRLLQLQEATAAPVILFAAGYEMSHPLVSALQAGGISRWVTSDALTTMYEQFAQCRDGAENAVALAEQERIRKKELEENVAPGHRTIGFTGSSRGTGTTTQAVQFAMHLQSRGHTACYIEAAGQRHIETIPGFYDVLYLDKEKGYLQCRGLDMYYKPILVTPNMRLAYDVCVFDYGALGAETLSGFLSCTARVCVAGSKPWEYGLLRWAAGMLEKEETAYLFPLVDERERSFLRERVADIAEPLFAACAPGLFEAVPENLEIYDRLCEALVLTSRRPKVSGISNLLNAAKKESVKCANILKRPFAKQ